MGQIYVARSAKLCKWASDVGLGKHIYKVGWTEEPLKPLVEQGWAGETDWLLIKAQEAEGVDDETVITRLAAKTTMVDPMYYPRIKGVRGLFKVLEAHVENHLLVSRALAGQQEIKVAKLAPADFATYLVNNALK